MPTAVDHASITSQKVKRSRAALADFVTYQKQWLQKAEQALSADFPLETITICSHQIHALLRRGLWLRAQCESLHAPPKAWNDDWLLGLLLQPEHDGMERAPDREIYNAACRFEVIDEDTCLRLGTLLDQSAAALRENFSRSAAVKTRPDLVTLAREYLKASHACLLGLEQQFRDFDTQLSALLSVTAR